VLREATGGKREVEASGTSVRDVLADLGERYPALGERILEDGELAQFVNLYLDGEDVRTRDGLETRVGDGATLILLPAMAGGGIGPAAAGDGAARADQRQHRHLPRPRREAEGLLAHVRHARERDRGAEAAARAVRRKGRLLARRAGLERRGARRPRARRRS